MPVVHHTSNRGRVIRAEAVLPQLEEGHKDRDECDSYQCQLMSGREVLLYPLFCWVFRLGLSDCRCCISHKLSSPYVFVAWMFFSLRKDTHLKCILDSVFIVFV